MFWAPASTGCVCLYQRGGLGRAYLGGTIAMVPFALHGPDSSAGIEVYRELGRGERAINQIRHLTDQRQQGDGGFVTSNFSMTLGRKRYFWGTVLP